MISSYQSNSQLRNQCISVYVLHRNHQCLHSALFCFVCISAATSDATVSLAWCPYDANLLITGQAQKFIRVFDIRGEGSLNCFTITHGAHHEEGRNTIIF